MNQQQRNELLKRQLRSFTPGIVEFINDQWIFFNDENDEAYPLEDYLQREMEVFRGSRWRKGFLSDLGTITLRKENLTLLHQEKVFSPMYFYQPVLHPIEKHYHHVYQLFFVIFHIHS